MKKSTRLILKIGAAVFGLIGIVSVCAVDSMSYVPAVLCGVSIIVCALCANKLGWMRPDWEDEE